MAADNEQEDTAYDAFRRSHPLFANVTKQNFHQFVESIGCAWERSFESPREDAIIKDQYAAHMCQDVIEPIKEVSGLTDGPTPEGASIGILVDYFMEQALKQHGPAIHQVVKFNCRLGRS